ncbi:hypothetical protein JCM5353_000200 [Sporobolomyces roseus]
MASNDTQYFYGTFIGATELCVAALAYANLEKLLRRRICDGDYLSLDNESAPVHLSRLPQEIWTRIMGEAIASELEGATEYLAKEAAFAISDSDPWSYFDDDGPYVWTEEMHAYEFDWEKFVREQGGVLGGFRRTLGALDLFYRHHEVIVSFLRKFGLGLATIQSFTLESDPNSYHVIPVAFHLASNASKPPSSLAEAILVTKRQDLVSKPFISVTHRSTASASPTLDIVFPYDREEDPSTLTISAIDNARLNSIPSSVQDRFKRLYRVLPLGDSSSQTHSALYKKILLIKH